MTLVFDTETTGLADFKQPAEHPCQPRIAQLGAILYDNDWNERVVMNLIVQPFGFDIPISASNVHGITNELAKKHGIDENNALDLFDTALRSADVVVAHNIKYDMVVIRRAWFVHNRRDSILFTKLLMNGFCTMTAMTSVCKIPGRYDDYKWPSLQEAYVHCFGEEFSGAHDAMSDVRACARIYRWLQERKTDEVLTNIK